MCLTTRLCPRRASEKKTKKDTLFECLFRPNEEGKKIGKKQRSEEEDQFGLLLLPSSFGLPAADRD